MEAICHVLTIADPPTYTFLSYFSICIASIFKRMEGFVARLKTFVVKVVSSLPVVAFTVDSSACLTSGNRELLSGQS